jgi:hypothetical protein
VLSVASRRSLYCLLFAFARIHSEPRRAADADSYTQCLGLGVVHNVEQNAQQFFTRHRAEISCIALHPARVYFVSSVCPLSKCASLLCQEDSQTDNYVFVQDIVATGDLAENSSVWVWSARDLEHSTDSMEWECEISIHLKVWNNTSESVRKECTHAHMRARERTRRRKLAMNVLQQDATAETHDLYALPSMKITWSC